MSGGVIRQEIVNVSDDNKMQLLIKSFYAIILKFAIQK